MNRFVRHTIVIPALIGLVAIHSAAAAELRVATVDLRKVFENFWKTKQADSILQDRRNALGAEFKELIKQGEKIKADYDKALDDANDPAVAVDERDRRKKAALAKKGELDEIKRSTEQFDASAKSNLSEQHRRMRDNILELIRATVRDMAKAGGYDLVMDSSAESQNNNTTILVFSSGKNDLTEALLAELNKDAPPNFLKQAAPREPEKKEK
jgi:outer membrane protein